MYSTGRYIDIGILKTSMLYLNRIETFVRRLCMKSSFMYLQSYKYYARKVKKTLILPFCPMFYCFNQVHEK